MGWKGRLGVFPSMLSVFSLLAVMAGADPAQRAFKPAEWGVPASYFLEPGLPNVSIIVPAHNAAPYILRTIAALEKAVQFAQKSLRPASNTSLMELNQHMEIIIVDDGSTDNTVAIVMHYIEDAKSRGITNPVIKLVALRKNLFAGAARNIGRRLSKGNLIMFGEADDLYEEEHIALCMLHLVNPDSPGQWAGKVHTRLNIDIPLVHPTWQDRVETTYPGNQCFWRKVYDFLEGYPEGGIWKHHEDVGLTHMIRACTVPTKAVQIPNKHKQAEWRKHTVTYVRYPGNSLDKQVEKFAIEPTNAKLSEMERAPEEPVRENLMSVHNVHLNAKMERLKKGEPLGGTNPFWGIYSHTMDEMKEDWLQVDVDKIKYLNLKGYAELEKGTILNRSIAAEIADKFKEEYLANNPDPPQRLQPLLFVYSSYPEGEQPLVGANVNIRTTTPRAAETEFCVGGMCVKRDIL